MVQVDIQFSGDQLRYFTGDQVSGKVIITDLPAPLPKDAVRLSAHCLGEVKFTDYPGSPYFFNGQIYYDDFHYWDQELPVNESDLILQPESHSLTVPFAFTLPIDEDLPSSMISKHGFIQYYVQVFLELDPKPEVKKYIREFIVQAPLERGLQISVGACAEKLVLLHAGKVSVQASLPRKGWAPGEWLSVLLAVNNNTNTRLIPRVSLHQVQLFSTGVRHKTIETMLSPDPICGPLIEPFRDVTETIRVPVPEEESLSIKCSGISVKYFLHITIDIPHSLDLHVNLPVVITAQAIVDRILEEKAQSVVKNL